MQVGKVAVRLAYSLIGALMLASFWQSGAVAQDGHSQHQTTAPENKERTSALVKVVRESTRRFQDPQVALNWAWKDNPQGTFANWNPNVSCDAYNPQN